jgi:hypothetical protein
MRVETFGRENASRYIRNCPEGICCIGQFSGNDATLTAVAGVDGPCAGETRRHCPQGCLTSALPASTVGGLERHHGPSERRHLLHSF